MKKLIVLSAFCASAIAAAPAFAQSTTATGNFDVRINLTSKCEINSTNGATGAVIDNLSMNYTSFQLAAATGSTNFNVRCTTTQPFTLALDSASVTDGATGLAYTLALATSSSATASSPVASLTGLAGTGSNVTYYVKGNVVAGQPGTSTAGAANNTRTLTVTY